MKKFDKSFTDYRSFAARYPEVVVKPGYENGVETCDYLFTY